MISNFKKILLVCVLMMCSAGVFAENVEGKPMVLPSLTPEDPLYAVILYKTLENNVVEDTSDIESRYTTTDYYMGFLPMAFVDAKVKGVELRTKTRNMVHNLYHASSAVDDYTSIDNSYNTSSRNDALYYIILHNQIHQRSNGADNLLDPREYTRSDADVNAVIEKLKGMTLVEDDIDLLLSTTGPIFEKMAQANQFNEGDFSKKSKLYSLATSYNLEWLAEKGALIGSDLEKVYQGKVDKNSPYYASSKKRLEKYEFYLSNFKTASK